ncbi:MAG TPA: glycoside hydrolase family 2 TIM barrel-domain containing protein, partial [Anaerolineaceae bacterium]|nr:glycoside hydrolase family 2 TIM barrel-domain containing protein [Anaerolineaceae bacterium]
AAQVDPNYPLPEYPRPQLVRADWQNLNGLWDYAILPASANAPTLYEGKILVPFAVESALSRVGRPLLPNQTLWYNRTFEVPSSWRGRRVLLHFGAVDWLARVWLNGSFIGEHSGGYLPFSFEITPQLDWNRPNELRVAVMDPTDTERQALGKQTLHPKEIWYTPVSGIWQTVWLEPLAQTALHALRLTPDIDHGLLHLQAVLDGAKDGNFLLEATVMEENRLTAQITVPAGEKFDLQIPAPRLWTPTTPFLYGLRLRLLGHGQVLDEVTSYFAMRKFGIEKDADGFVRFTLNNRPIFLFGPLDQGYFPDGLYTAPTDAALRFDIEYTRKLGCNLIRKHVKIEPARWYYHCDQLGMIVWQDMPNGGKPVGSLRTLLAIGLGRNESDNSHYKRFGRESSGNRADFEAEIQAMLKHLYNTPCIAVWVPFNEGWGQFDSARITKQIKAWDPTRLVDSASGWFDQGAGDFESLHIYGLRLRRRNPQAKTAQRAFVISEFGGYSLALERHLWDAHKKFGYRFYKTSQALTEAYLELLEDQLKPLIRQGLAAAIYTQTTDVETEINGYLTYDRAVEKMPADRLAAAHRKIINILGK